MQVRQRKTEMKVERGVMEPQAKDCQQLLAPERGKEWNLPWHLQEEPARPAV